MTALIILSAVSLAALLALIVIGVVALWPRRSAGCPLMSRPCIKADCRFWSTEHGTCGLNLAIRHYLDVEAGGPSKSMAKRYGLTQAE